MLLLFSDANTTISESLSLIRSEICFIAVSMASDLTSSSSCLAVDDFYPYTFSGVSLNSELPCIAFASVDD